MHSAEPSEIEAAVQRQRFAISAEIHDSLLPYLFVTKMRLESLQHRMAGEASDGPHALDREHNLQLIEESLQSIDTAQRIGRNLLRSLDVEESLQTDWHDFLLQQLQSIGLGDERMEVTGQTDDSLPSYVRVAIRGIARESITNSLHHGRAKLISVNLQSSPTVQHKLTIRDYGDGFDPSQQTLGYGSRFMRVRAATIGGELIVDSRIGGPTSVTLTW